MLVSLFISYSLALIYWKCVKGQINPATTLAIKEYGRAGGVPPPVKFFFFPRKFAAKFFCRVVILVGGNLLFPRLGAYYDYWPNVATKTGDNLLPRKTGLLPPPPRLGHRIGSLVIFTKELT